MDYLIFLKPLYFMIPAYFANMAPVPFSKLRFFSTPVDFEKKWKGKPIFGSHKTWRGLVLAAIAGLLFFWIQQMLYSAGIFQNLALIDYSSFPVWLGALLGFGAIFGDLVKSFFKRRLAIAPGKRWVPFDQIDLVFGALAFSCFYFAPPLWVWIFLAAITIPLHIIVKQIGYYSRISNQKW